jgi:hypothetical protein
MNNFLFYFIGQNSLISLLSHNPSPNEAVSLKDKWQWILEVPKMHKYTHNHLQ